MRASILSFLSVMAISPVTAQAASPADGMRSIYLEDTTGTRVHIAGVNVKSGRYTIEMKSESFSDHFLSMRPFKCVDGPAKTWCHVPYLYPIARDISVELTDLEYDLLFLWKDKGEYGIDLWNGVYYQLEATEDGRIRGHIHEMDMNILSAPPEDGNLRPIREVDLEPGEVDSHWLPSLVIE